MVNEIRMKQLEKQLDELDDTFNEAVSSGVPVSDQFREHYRAIADEYNGMVAEQREEAKQKFLAKLDEPVKLEPKGEVPW